MTWMLSSRSRLADHLPMQKVTITRQAKQ